MPWSVVFAFAAAYAAFFVASVRSGRGRFFSFTIPLVQVIALYHDSPNQRVVSFHGFFQYAIVYEILNGHIPPRNSLLAGEPLAYPWAEHVLLAAISRGLGVSPALACAILNVACLVAALWLLSRIARDFAFDEPRTTAFVLLPLLGVVFLAFSAVSAVLGPFVPVRLEWRGAPLIGHFNVPTGGTLGIVFFLAFLHALMRTVGGAAAPWTIFAAAVGAGISYPPMFPGILAAFVMFAIVLLTRAGEARTAPLVHPSIAIVAATTIVMPYLTFITAGMTHEVRPGFHRALVPLFGGVLEVALAIFPVAALVYALRRPWREAFRPHQDALVLLLAVTAGLAAAFAVTHYQGWGEYKLAILMNLVLAMIAAPAVAELALSRPLVAGAVLTLFFLPVGIEVHVMYSAWNRVDHPWIEQGTRILPVSPPERELYAWVRDNTRPSDAFVDSQLTLPTFAERPLWVGLDPPMAGNRAWKDGWLLQPRELVVDFLGANPDLFDCRERLARAVFTPSEDVDRSLEALAHAAPEDGLWIVARRGAVRNRLKASRRATPVFANRAAVVFHLPRDPSAPSECDPPIRTGTS